jgi:thioredoxin-like negative regulator of GroEL
MKAMHIPTVTDQMLDKVLEAAASPVLVEFREGTWSCLVVHNRIQAIAEDWDDRIIFVRIDVDENPTPQAAYRALELPCIVIFCRGVEFGRCMGNVDRDTMERLLERAIEKDTK